MLTTIKGIYNNGEITLEEKPHILQPTEVLVTFVEEVGKKPLRKAGFGKGNLHISVPTLMNRWMI